MKKKLQIFAVMSIVIAAVGIIVFWIAGFCDKMELSKIAFFIAGVSGWLFLITKGVIALRKHRFHLN